MLRCELHDYVEIACTFQYQVQLSLNTGETITGKAVDIQLDGNREECLKLKVEQEHALVRLTDILQMKSCANNPHFDLVEFQ